MLRILTALCLAALEATIITVPLRALTPLDLSWIVCWIVIAAGWFTEQLALRVPTRFERVLLATGALIALLGSVATRLPLSALLLGNPAWPLAYLLAFIGLFLFWRGTRLPLRDSSLTLSIVSRGALLLLVSLMLGPIFNPLGDRELLTSYVLGFIGFSLMSLALVRTHELATPDQQPINWRWILVIGGAIGVVVGMSVLISAALSGGDALAVARGLIQALIFPFALIGGAIAYLFLVTIGEPLSRLIQAIFANLELLPEPPQPTDEALGELEALPTFELIERLAETATWLLALIPLGLLLVGILLIRRRRNPASDQAEERESLGITSNLQRDLRDLLGRLRNPFARRRTGLAAALAALQGTDPTTRVRRAYVRLLLLLEQRALVRPSHVTPSEFVPLIDTDATVRDPIATLTNAYERARYDPTGADGAAATAAEAALQVVEQQRQPMS